MFTRIKGPWGALGVMLALIALYLVLVRGRAATAIISASSDGLGNVFKVLQGR